MHSTVTFDVRPILAQGLCPFDAIMEQVDLVVSEGCLKLLCPFDPEPLHAALSRRGFELLSRSVEDGAHVLVFKKTGRMTELQPVVLMNLDTVEVSMVAERIQIAYRELASGQALIAESTFDPEPYCANLEPQPSLKEVNVPQNGKWELCLVRE